MELSNRVSNAFGGGNNELPINVDGNDGDENNAPDKWCWWNENAVVRCGGATDRYSNAADAATQIFIFVGLSAVSTKGRRPECTVSTIDPNNTFTYYYVVSTVVLVPVVKGTAAQQHTCSMRACSMVWPSHS